jgi:squalene-hopene/tetraprenyl-beta-curcumene cyclase
LFYYYMLLAQALDVAGIDQVSGSAHGKASGDDSKARQPVAWREELSRELAKLQREDGAWQNDRNSRWYEGQAVLCTCYALLALEHCH